MIYKHVFKESLIQFLMMAFWYTHEAQQPACFSCCRDCCFYWWPDCGCPGAVVWVRGRWGSSKPSSARAGIQQAAIPVLPLADNLSEGADKPHELWFRWGKCTSLWHLPLGLVWRQLCFRHWVAFSKENQVAPRLSDSPPLVRGREILYFC